MTEQDHQDIVDRLRALGRQPVPFSVAAAHLATISGVRGRGRFTRHARRVAVVAAVAVLAATGAGAVAFVGEPGDGAEKIATAGPGGDPAGATRPDDAGGPADDDTCTGPPPFAGVIPESGQIRADEAAEHSSVRQDCPTTDDTAADGITDTTDTLGAPDGAVVDPHPDDPCTGPPPFAGVIPESGQIRADEAAEHSSVRQDCPTTDDTAADGIADTTDTLGAPDGAVVDPHPDDPCTGPPPFAGVIPESGQIRADEAAEHSSVRQDCPTTDDTAADDTSPGAVQNAGPPASTPAGPSEGIGGPPTSTPPGAPEGVGGGPPASTPAGPPEGVVGGRPASTPAGPPESIPAGPRDGAGGNGPPSGPPAGAPGGPGD